MHYFFRSRQLTDQRKSNSRMLRYEGASKFSNSLTGIKQNCYHLVSHHYICITS